MNRPKTRCPMKEYSNGETTVHALRWFSGHPEHVESAPERSQSESVQVCKKCNHFYMDHGFLVGSGFICPGDYLVFDDNGAVQVMPAGDFEEMFL